MERSGERLGALKGVLKKRILFSLAKETRVGVGENIELGILNRDI